MNIIKNKNRIFDFLFLAWSVFLIISLQTNTAFSQTIRRGGDFLQPGDINTSHILNATILDIDVNANAAIEPLKIRGGLPVGSLLLSGGSRIATSSNFYVATSTNDFYILDGRIHATSTNFNGLNNTWPTVDGTSGQALTTDGAGTFSFTTPGGSNFTLAYVTGEAIAIRAPVWVATSTVANQDANVVPQAAVIGFGNCGANTTRVAQSFLWTGSAIVVGGHILIDKDGTASDNVLIELVNSSAGAPGSTVYASSTIANASISLTQATTTFSFAHSYIVVPSTTYWWRISRTGACSDTEDYNLGYDTADSYSGGSRSYEQSSTWTNVSTQDSTFTASTTRIIQDRIYKTNGSNASTASTTVGVANATAAVNVSTPIVVEGIVTGFSGLTTGAPLYACNIYGGICAAVPDFPFVVARAMSSTTIKIAPDLMK